MPDTIFSFQHSWQTIQQPCLRWLVRHTYRFLERLLGLQRLHQIYQIVQRLPESIPFSSRVLRVMKVKTLVSDTSLARIPEKGPLVIIANHPFGAIEGLALLDTLRSKRPDVKILGNYILRRIPELSQEMFFVDPFGTAQSATRNVQAMRHALQWIKEGHALILFPAGEVASFEPKAFHVRDAVWHESLMPFLRKANLPATFLPIFIPGSASLLFHLVGKIHPRLRTTLLVRELLRKYNASITLHIGHPITTAALFQRFTSNADALRYLRFRTFLLAGRQGESWFNTQMRRLTLDTSERINAPLDTPISPADLVRELTALPPEATLFTTEDHILYAIQGEHIPVTLKEIGRLRELTFREAGEGTGNTTDIDEFDAFYYQIILWHKAKREIVGCYRLALSDDLVEHRGLTALYTRTLFQFDERFLGHLPGPAIELGRSFVRPNYQRTFAPLLLLWRGILTFVARHPRYTTLFGPVSISNDFSEAGTTLLVNYLRENAYDAHLAKWVSARLPPKPVRFVEWQHPDYADFRKTEADLAMALAEVEDDRREMPTLIRHYLKLGGKMVAFNIDPDFGTAIDGLITVDLLKAPSRDIARFMGKETYQRYYALHQEPLACES